jgi:hypothetical protein
MSTSKPEIREGGGDDLLPAVVPVLAHLGEQDARASAFALRANCGDASDDRFDGASHAPHLGAVDAVATT